MLAQFADVCCASMPLEGLAALGEVRTAPGVMVLRQPTRTWVRWEAGDERVLQRVLPVPNVVLYAFRGGRWYRLGGHLPIFDAVTEGNFQPLCHVLFPAPVQPLASPNGPWAKIDLCLRPDGRPQPTSAMICLLQDLVHWMDAIPSSRLAALQGARNRDRTFVLGPRLPLLPFSQRLWGDTILKPLGFRLEPDLPDRVVHECLNLTEENLLIIVEGQCDVLCRSDLRPLNRASLKLAMREATP